MVAEGEAAAEAATAAEVAKAKAAATASGSVQSSAMPKVGQGVEDRLVAMLVTKGLSARIMRVQAGLAQRLAGIQLDKCAALTKMNKKVVLGRSQ